MFELAAIPEDELLRMKKQGMTNEEINERLQGEGFSLAQIAEAMTQMSSKGAEAQKKMDNEPKDMESSELDKEPTEEEIPIPVPTPTKEPEERQMPERGGGMPQRGFAQQQQMPSFGTKPIVADIQALVEEIVNEKWGELISTLGDFNIWRSRISDDNEAIKQEMIRMQGRIENLQSAVLGKVKEYDKDIKEVTSEMKALEKVFQNIMEPLVMNIKELSRITEDLKKKK